MNKPGRLLVFVALAIVLAIAYALWVGRSRGRDALAKYKAELRARGEALSWADMGYPRPALTNDSLPQLLAAVDRLGHPSFDPSQLAWMNFTGPGRAQACWSGANPRFNSYAPAVVTAMSWAELTAIFQKAEPDLAVIRSGLESPPAYFIVAPTNVFMLPRNPFVQKRKLAQWLSGDLIVALHDRQMARAQEDLHALTQMVELHRHEPTLVNQMIRVAIAGLALSDTWEALQAEGWTEEALATLQTDWEKVDLLEAIETGIARERTLGAEAITMLRSLSAGESSSLMRTWTWSSTTPKSPGDYLHQWVFTPLWRLNADADELLFLQHHQKCLDSLRKLRTGMWPVVSGELDSHSASLDKLLGNKLAAIRFWFCAMGIPNTRRAAQTAVRNEMQRRLTVTAIALERHRLRHGGYPTNLAALVPEFLKTVPVDLMNAQPLNYRLNPDATFTLYSVGEDGRDDGGDPNSATATGKFDLWSGRDAVWPVRE